MYKVLRNLLFLLPAEKAHYFSMGLMKALCSIPFLRKIMAIRCTGKGSRELLGLHFRNAVGLGAGFDKNALYLEELDTLGFGFVEIGTVTPLAQPGNEKPRLFRLKKDEALINRMGFNNQGVEEVAGRLRQWMMIHSGNKERMLVGGNIGKNKNTPNEVAWKDYETCFRALHSWVDFFVVNVSSPNTPGLRALQDREALKKILVRLQEVNREHEKQRPILLKIAPDLWPEQVDEIVELSMEIRLSGIVATNTTISREGLSTSAQELEKIGPGGLSGRPLMETSTSLLASIHACTGGKLVLVGSGGIHSAADAARKINAGADLVEVWTGFIYEGPGIVKRICKGLSK